MLVLVFDSIRDHYTTRINKKIMSLIDDLKWRYATKKMNGTKVPQEKIDYIL